jgi:hypothetical protein
LSRSSSGCLSICAFELFDHRVQRVEPRFPEFLALIETEGSDDAGTWPGFDAIEIVGDELLVYRSGARLRTSLWVRRYLSTSVPSDDLAILDPLRRLERRAAYDDYIRKSVK